MVFVSSRCDRKWGWSLALMMTWPRRKATKVGGVVFFLDVFYPLRGLYSVTNLLRMLRATHSHFFSGS